MPVNLHREVSIQKQHSPYLYSPKFVSGEKYSLFKTSLVTKNLVLKKHSSAKVSSV